ncbi:phosphotransferase family protein [Vibrio vulnificus]
MYRKYINIINQEVSSGEVVCRVFRYNNDFVISAKVFDSKIKYLLSVLCFICSTVCFNFSELIKSKVKRRKYNGYKLCFSRVSFLGWVHINLTNSTAVVVEHDVVLKFYLANLEYYSELYNFLNVVNGYEIKIDNGFIILKQQKLADAACSYCVSELIRLSKQPLLSINDLNVTSDFKTRFTLSSRINLMYAVHNFESDTELTQYIKFARLIEEVNNGEWKEGFRLCHGDMWVENIMFNHQGEPVLIDFDKVMYFHPAFDYCYLYVMESDGISGVDLKSKLSSIGFLADDLINLIKDESLNMKFTHFDIKMSILTVFFLKLSERDFYQRRFGYSLVQLEQAFNAILIDAQRLSEGKDD